MKIADKFSAWYAKKNRCERAMLLCTLCVAAVLWLSSEISDCSALNAEFAWLSVSKKVSKTAADCEPVLRGELDELLKKFDSKRKISPVSLQIAVENCARSAGLSYSLSNVSQSDAGSFSVYVITLSCRRAELKSLADFERAMRALEPHIGIVSAVFDGSATGEVGAKYTIKAVGAK